MAITNGYLTVEKLNRKMGRDISETLSEECIERASRFIDSYTDRIYYSKTLVNEVVDSFELSESGLIVTDDYTLIRFPCPIISISAIFNDDELLVSDDYVSYLRNGAIYKNRWSSLRGGVKFSGVIGYSSTPENVQNWCATIAAALTGRDVVSYTDSDETVTEVVKNAIPKWVLNDMEKNRRIIL